MNKEFFKTGYQEFIYVRTYSRWLDEEKRRESWKETVTRYCDFMKSQLGDKISDKEIKDVHNAILNLEVMPSMRALWSAGDAAKNDNFAIYNCSFMAIEKLKDFATMLYILMHGTGVGFSVERKYVSNLPVIKEASNTTKEEIIFEDSKMGWAKGFQNVLECLWDGTPFECNFTKIRPRGSRLKTFGGRASGPEPLADLIKFVTEIVERNRGMQLQPIDVHDICCKIAEVVVVGGVRRSALISLSDLTDNQMANAKMGEFYKIHPHRQLANNSVSYSRKPDIVSFIDEWKNLYRSKSGERGIFNKVAAQKKASENNRRDGSKVVGTNPCIIGDTLIAVADGRNAVPIKQLAEDGIDIPIYSTNLSTGKIEIKYARNPRKTKEKAEVWKLILDDGSFLIATPDHKILKKDLTYCELKNLQCGDSVSPFYSYENNKYRQIANIGAKMIGDYHRSRRQYRVIHEFYNGITDAKTYAIHHKDFNNKNDNINNLEVILHEEHKKIHSEKMKGKNNPYYKMTDEQRFKFASHPGKYNPKYINVSNSELIQHGKKLFKQFGNLTKSMWIKYAKENSLPQFLNNKFRFGKFSNFKNQVATNHKVVSVEFYGYEDVYNLTVDDNNNYNIITKYDDEKYITSSGICIKNCGEILLRSKSLCNLTEVIVRPNDTFETLKRKVQIATMIGTWQASMTNFKFADKDWKINCEEEALLGVSLSGLKDNKILNSVNDTAKKWLSDLKHVAISTNKKVAQKIGINRAAAITCVKPSGTVSQLVDCSPGAHSRITDTGYYVRRVRISVTDPLYKMLKEQGIKMKCEVGQSPDNCNTWVVEFPCTSPMAHQGVDTALNQLQYWKMLRDFWCEHNPSITIYVKEDEWLETASWVYKNFDDVGGLSFLPASDHVYQLAPYEDITKEEYEKMVSEMPPINFTELNKYEDDDYTEGAKEYACVGGACEIK